MNEADVEKNRGQEIDVCTCNKNDIFRDIAHYVNDKVNLDDIVEIVEYGCGTGCFLVEGIMHYVDTDILNKINYLGIDIDAFRLQNAKEIYDICKEDENKKCIKNLETHNISTKGMLIRKENRSVDFVFFVRSFHDFDINHMCQALYQSMRMLKQGGKLIIFDKNIDMKFEEVDYILMEQEDFSELFRFEGYILDKNDVDFELGKEGFFINVVVTKNCKEAPGYEQIMEKLIDILDNILKRTDSKIDKSKKLEHDKGYLDEDERKTLNHYKLLYCTLDRQRKLTSHVKSIPGELELRNNLKKIVFSTLQNAWKIRHPIHILTKFSQYQNFANEIIGLHLKFLLWTLMGSPLNRYYDKDEDVLAQDILFKQITQPDYGKVRIVMFTGKKDEDGITDAEKYMNASDLNLQRKNNFERSIGSGELYFTSSKIIHDEYAFDGDVNFDFGCVMHEEDRGVGFSSKFDTLGQNVKRSSISTVTFFRFGMSIDPNLKKLVDFATDVESARETLIDHIIFKSENLDKLLLKTNALAGS